MKCLIGCLVVITWVLSGWLTPAWAIDLTQGAHLFEVHCVGCHVNGGNIIRRGKTLKQKALDRNGYGTVEAIADLVANGKANMSAYRDRLTADEIQAVASYVLQQAANDWKATP